MSLLPSGWPALVIFDWDDTLVDSYGAVHLAINAARAAFQLPTWTLEETRQNCRIALKEIFPIWFGADWHRAQDVFYATFAEHHLTRLAPKPGAEELLKLFHARGIPLAVNSNKKSDYLRAEIARLGWSDYFRSVVGAGDAPHGKPAPDGVRAILAQCPQPLDKTWFIGDNQIDTATARAAGVHPVRIGEPEAASSEVVFESLKGFGKYLQGQTK